MRTKRIQCLMAAMLGVVLTLNLHAQTSAFTYQGQLTDNGSPANGFFDIFTGLWDAQSGGATVGPASTNTAVSVSNGLFTVTLDFGANVFDGNARWLEIGVATNGSGAFTTLSPRQPLASAPYAVRAANAGVAASASSVAAGNITGTINVTQLPTSLITNGASGVSISGTFSGNGSGLTNVPGDNLGNHSATQALNLNGNHITNAGTVTANAFVGGTLRALQFQGGEDTLLSGNNTVIGGGSLNTNTGNLSGLLAGQRNVIEGSRNFIGAGRFNFIGNGSDNGIVGGQGNLILQNGSGRGFNSAIGGGRTNVCSQNFAVIGGGRLNVVTNNDSDNIFFCTIGGGDGNFSAACTGTIAGGWNNTNLSGFAPTVGGGRDNTADGNYTTVSGGQNNSATGVHATIPGGRDNEASGDYSFAAGRRAKAVHNGALVWADNANQDLISTANNQFLARATGGFTFLTSSSEAEGLFVGADGSVGIGAGAPQTDLEVEATAPEIRLTDGRADSGGVTGLELGKISWYARDTSNVNDYDPVAAIEVIADNGTVAPDGKFQFRTGINGVLTTRMVISSGGSVGIGTDNPSEALHVIGNILASGTVTGSSDRNVKENFSAVDPQEVLERVSAMPIQRWNYIGEQTPHLGPVAQDFYSAFQVGMDDKHISMVDADGVALAAIQGLNQKLEIRLEQKQTEIKELKARLEKLEQLISDKLNGGAK